MAMFYVFCFHLKKKIISLFNIFCKCYLQDDVAGRVFLFQIFVFTLDYFTHFSFKKNASATCRTMQPAVFFLFRYLFSLQIISHIFLLKKCKWYLQDDVAGGVANLRVLTAPPLEIHLTRVWIFNSFLFFCQEGYKTIKLAQIWILNSSFFRQQGYKTIKQAHV